MNSAAHTATTEERWDWCIVDESCEPGTYLDSLENATRVEFDAWWAEMNEDGEYDGCEIVKVDPER